MINVVNNIVYIISPTYLSNSITTIYTSLNNYLLSCATSITTKKNLNLQDSSIDFHVNAIGTVVEYLSYNMLFSSPISYNNLYNYKFLNEPLDNLKTFNLSVNEIYKLNTNYSENITRLDINNRTLVLSYSLDNSSLLNTTDYTTVDIMVQHNINSTDTVDINTLTQNTKGLKINLINNGISTTNDIYNYLKPWGPWSLLNGINGALSLTSLVNNVYISWSYVSSSVVKITNTPNNNNSYLTNNEVTMLTSFLQVINTSDIARANYVQLTQIIEPLLIANLNTWLTNPQFFLNVTNNINTFLKYSGYNNVSFDGMNLIFSNDMNPTLNSNNEIASYITNEFTI